MDIKPNIEKGLTKEEVEFRINNDLYNKDTSIKTKSIKNIILENVFTLFNIVNIILGVLVLTTKSYVNLLFLGIVGCNLLISTIQSIRTKLILDKLNVLATNKVEVIRDYEVVMIDICDIVVDDIMVLKPGNQVVVDCIIKKGNVTVNESFITGESDTIDYTEEESLKSGSFIVNGNCKAIVTHVREDNYIAIISKDAKYLKPINSILLNSIKKIIKWISIFILPTSIFLFMNQYGLNNNYNDAVLNTVAALIGMLPGGLVLLISTVLAISVIKLSRLKVLVQELYCIEMLARVDVVCFDKTGTLTTGELELVDVVLFDEYNIDEIIGNYLKHMGVENNTTKAISEYYKEKETFEFVSKKVFNSVDKYGSVTFSDATYKLGAPEAIYKRIQEIIDVQKENRVVLLTKNDKPVAYFVLSDKLKETAGEMISYLKNEGVEVLIISGDNHLTVSHIAKKVGLDVNALNLSEVELTKELVLSNNIFGRVTPVQKKEIIKILQENGKYVAMAGDGVNDVLALKQADCSISIKDATDMAKNVSQIILLDSEYDAIVPIINEGRKTVNNIERSATLFLSKNISLILLSLCFIFINIQYPFLPVHLSLTNFFTIGIPSFILALEPTNEKISGNFFIKILNRALPTAMVILLNVLIIVFFANMLELNESQTSTISLILFAYTGFMLLVKQCIPFTKMKYILLATLLIGFILSTIFLHDLFILSIISFKMLLIILIGISISTVVFTFLVNIFPKFIKQKK